MVDVFVHKEWMERVLEYNEEIHDGLVMWFGGYQKVGERTVLWHLQQLLATLASATDDELLGWMLWKASDFVSDAHARMEDLHAQERDGRG